MRGGRLLPPLVAGMLKSGSPRSFKVFRGVPNHSEAFRGLRTPRNALGPFGRRRLHTYAFQALIGGGAAFAAVSAWNALSLGVRGLGGVPRCFEAFRGVGTPRNTSKHLGRLWTPRQAFQAITVGARLCRRYPGMLKSGSPKPPEVFRGAPRPRNASERLGTPRNSSEHLETPSNTSEHLGRPDSQT